MNVPGNKRVRWSDAIKVAFLQDELCVGIEKFFRFFYRNYFFCFVFIHIFFGIYNEITIIVGFNSLSNEENVWDKHARSFVKISSQIFFFFSWSNDNASKTVTGYHLSSLKYHCNPSLNLTLLKPNYISTHTRMPIQMNRDKCIYKYIYKNVYTNGAYAKKSLSGKKNKEKNLMQWRVHARHSLEDHRYNTETLKELRRIRYGRDRKIEWERGEG